MRSENGVAERSPRSWLTWSAAYELPGLLGL